VLELAVLGLLKEQPLHGYDLRKRLRATFGLLANLSFGSLYPALARLEAAGALQTLEVTATPVTDALLPTGSLGGERATLVARRATAKAAAALGGRGTRARKVYTITPAGEELFERLLSEPTNDEDARAFEARLVFARHLSPTARVRLLERRRFQLIDRLERARRSDAEDSDFYARAVAEHTLDTIAADLAFVERLLDAERDPSRTRPTHPRERSARSPRTTATTGRITQ
jgi:DNA-binding PadR family transcriptional regulator